MCAATTKASKPLDLTTLKLLSGSHSRRSEGVCLLEAVAWFAGEPHTDQPECVSGVLASYGRAFNDGLPEADRQRLVPYVERLVGTATTDLALERQRAFMAADAGVRIFAPLALRAAGLTAEADNLAGLGEVVDEASAEAAAAAAWSAARSAAAAARSAAAIDEGFALFDRLIALS